MEHQYKIGYNAYMREWNKKNPEKVRASRRAYYLKNKDKYKQWKKEYNAKHPEKVSEWHKKAAKKYYRKQYENDKDFNSKRFQKRRVRLAGREQSPICEICYNVCTTLFDHDHKTGKFRGWICRRCNNTLGMVQDNIELLKNLGIYLEKHSSQEAT